MKMSYIPSIRARKNHNKNKEGRQREELEKNEYWQGYLNDLDTELLKGFDQCAEKAVSDFFTSLAIYKNVLMKAFGVDENSDEDPTNIDLNVILSKKSISGEDYSREEISAMNKYTKIFKVIKECMVCHIDIERDILGVSMINRMEQEEYKEIKEAVDSGERHTCYTDMKDE